MLLNFENKCNLKPLQTKSSEIGGIEIAIPHCDYVEIGGLQDKGTSYAPIRTKCMKRKCLMAPFVV